MSVVLKTCCDIGILFVPWPFDRGKSKNILRQMAGAQTTGIPKWVALVSEKHGYQNPRKKKPSCLILSHTQMAMGQNPNRTPSEHPNPTTRIGSKTGGEFTHQPKWDPMGFDNRSLLRNIRPFPGIPRSCRLPKGPRT